MAQSDSDRILSAGKTVTFADGSEHTLRFGFLALKFIEDEMGGLKGALRSFGIDVDEKPDGDDKEVEVVFTPVAKTLAAGLAHEHVRGLRIPKFDDVYSWVLLNADKDRIAEYARQGFDALMEAIPDMRPKTEEANATLDPPSNGQTVPIPAFPGPTGTTLEPFATVAQSATSGG